MTEGQQFALDQLREIASSSGGDFEILSIRPPEDDQYLRVEITLRTDGIDRVDDGLPLRARERLWLRIPADFPFQYPAVFTSHKRFAGWPHVQWTNYLCLYVAPDTEWDPSDGMYGFIDRLWTWLERGAVNQLDAIGAPLHPPAVYPASGRTIVTRTNTPPVEDETWSGVAKVDEISDTVVEVTDWYSDPFSEEAVPLVAAAVLLAKPMPFEYPKKLSDLIRLILDRGPQGLFGTLLSAAYINPQGSGLYVIIGSPMRGIAGSDDLKQHLSVWYIEPEISDKLREAVANYSPDARDEEHRDEVIKSIIAWANDATVAWCTVLEDRPEIVNRRDSGAPVSVFADKTISLWGCGALGAHVAEYLARAGVKKLILHDRGTVGPGILVRQPYTIADIGRRKIDALEDKLNAIWRDIEIEKSGSDLLRVLDQTDDWTSSADILIDCTASRLVQSKFEQVRSASAAKIPVASMMISRKATDGLVVMLGSEYTGGPTDLFRKVKLGLARSSQSHHFLDAFYPRPEDIEIFQPEPGCSSPTFVGSHADVSALSAALLNVVASGLKTDETDVVDFQDAEAHLIRQFHVVKDGVDHMCGTTGLQTW